MSTQRDELAELLADTEYPDMSPAWEDRADRSPVKYFSRKTADALIAAGYTRPRFIAPDTAGAELEALAVGSVVLAHWEDGSQPDYWTMRCVEGVASSAGFGVASGKNWTGMAGWGATLTLLHGGGAA
ncbi:hypothetical protein ACQCSX_04300 [Pseudarthrobacter sp. P1]|uniref:hypothetical protein n=1 Tax=Pseudarthrobacter sp. P1 TaxID=3418418 RepID=UPI003CE818F1